MKKLYQKIIVSILSLAVMGTVCATAPVMAEVAGTSTPAEMYIDNTYQAYLKELPGNELVYEKSDNVSTEATAPLNNLLYAEYFGANPTSRPKAYSFQATDAYVLINLPQKRGYELKAVEVTIGLSNKTSTYQRPFDYYYSTDGSQWTEVETTTYTNGWVGTTNASHYYNYCETIKVPSTATKFKVQRNSNTVATSATAEISKNPTVMGFGFGYLPVEKSSILQFSASGDTETIDLLASGLIADGAIYLTPNSSDYDADGTNESLFRVKRNNSIKINAVDGYMITSIRGNFYSSKEIGKVKITLGTTSETIGWPGEAGSTPFTVSNEEGAATLIIGDITDGTATCGLYDIVITMEKIELETSIDSAADNGTAVTATATVANLGLAAYDSMELIIAGYDGSRFTGAATKTVYKADEDGTDSFTATLPTGTKSVKVFLWKDIDSLVPVLEPVELAVTKAVAE